VSNQTPETKKEASQGSGDALQLFREGLRGRFPGLGERSKTQRLAAIRMFCIECMGGSNQDARACAARACFLWPHRGASWAPNPQGPAL
jgi:hypothetical protein